MARMDGVVARVPVRLRLNWGFFAAAVGALGASGWAIRAGDWSLALFALGMAVAAFLVDRVDAWLRFMEDSELGSVRLGSLWLRADSLTLTLFGWQWRAAAVTAPLDSLVPGLLHVAAAGRAQLGSLGRGVDILARKLHDSPASDRVLRDVSHWSIASDGDSYTVGCYGAVLFDDELVLLPDGEDTWRRALAHDGPFPDTSSSTLVTLLAWVAPRDLATIAQAGATARDGQRRQRVEVQRNIVREGRYSRLMLDPDLPGGERLSFKLDRREQAALDTWLKPE